MNVFARNPIKTLELNKSVYYSFDTKKSTSLFTKNEYDFDKNFYNGIFEFKSPLTNVDNNDTPESYGRQRIAAYLHDSMDISGENQYTILDIGSGSADLARLVPVDDRMSINLVNCDVSGPFTDLRDKSLLVSGMEKLNKTSGTFSKVINVQYDFNQSEWPFRAIAFDFICSNMALHHIQYDDKSVIMEKIFQSLKPGGVLILNDVYEFNLERVMFTHEGKKGPIECTGYVESFKDTMSRLQSIGFQLSTITLQSQADESSYTEENLQEAMINLRETMPISKAIWYITATKP